MVLKTHIILLHYFLTKETLVPLWLLCENLTSLALETDGSSSKALTSAVMKFLSQVHSILAGSSCKKNFFFGRKKFMQNYRACWSWEVEEYENLLQLLATVKMGIEADKLSWKCKNGSFSVKSLNRKLMDNNYSLSLFPYKII